MFKAKFVLRVESQQYGKVEETIYITHNLEKEDIYITLATRSEKKVHPRPDFFLKSSKSAFLLNK